MSISRRDLLKYSALGLSTVVVSGGLMGCGGDDDDDIEMSFTHGVASGDPLSDRVILWTRAEPEDTDRHPRLLVRFEIATDEEFENITNNGSAEISADSDWTLKVDAVNLEPATVYYYRFSSNGNTSVVGKAKTLPAEDANVESVKLAMFSCSNYPAGYFNAYAEVAKLDDLDAVLHLGDYIYEYRMGEYATENAEAIGRALPEDNDVETIELEDISQALRFIPQRYRTAGPSPKCCHDRGSR